jgi:hypothetical protein
MPRVLDPVNNLADRFVAYKIGEVQVNSKGAKSARVENDGQQMIFNLGDRENPVLSPFGATTFNDELNSRQPVEFILDEKQEAHWAAFDTWAIAYLSEHSERIFKKTLTVDQVKDTYKSPVTRKENYPAHLRCKINTTGEKACRAWNTNNDRTDLPPLRNVPCVPRITLSHLWIMARECGFVLSVNDIMASPPPEIKCPF